MFCENCGNKLSSDSKFCGKCGDQVVEEHIKEDIIKNSEPITANNNSTSVNSSISDSDTNNNKKKGKKTYIIVASLIIALLLGTYGFYSNSSYASIRNFESKVNDYKDSFSNYIIGEHSESYEDIMATTSVVLASKEVTKMEDLLRELEDLSALVSEENTGYINSELEGLENKNLMHASDSEVKAIDKLISDVEKSLKKENFIEAEFHLDELEQAVELAATELNNLDMSIEQIDTSEYPKVKLYLDIDDENGDLVKNLDKKFFTLSEKLATDSDYIKKEIQKVVQLDQKESLNINMVADVSGSMEGYPIETAKTIMTNFLENVQFGSGDKVELTAFSDGVYTLTDFTEDKQDLINEISGLTTGSQTSLYDALFASVNKTAIENGAKCVIAFTDGKDNYSHNTPEDVLEVAQRFNIPIFIIGVGDDLDEYELENIAEGSNGFYSRISDFADMEEIYESIYRQNKELYVLEYETQSGENTSDARDININLQTKDHGGEVDYTYEPHVLMSAKDNMSGLSDIDSLISDYLEGYVEAINNHDFSYIAPYVTNGPLAEEVGAYIHKDIKERFVSVEIIDKNFIDDNTCVVTFHDTYEVQNFKEPLHLRTLRSEYIVRKQADGGWKIHAFNKKLEILSKINY